MKNTLAAVAAVLAAACASSGSDSTPSGSGPNEPNNTPAQAVPLALGTPVAGAISSASDVDYYKLSLSAPTSVRIRTFDRTGLTCDPTNSAVDTYVEVRDAAGVPLTVCNQATNFQPCDGNVDNYCEDFVVTLPAGDSFVVVTGNPPFPFDYTLSAEVAVHAATIALGVPASGTIASAASADRYRLTLPAPATVRIETFDTTGRYCDPANRAVDTYVEVTDAGGSPLTACDQANGFQPCDGNVNELCEDFALALPAGDSYVVVRGNPPFPFDYVLRVVEVPTDPHEPNDTRALATPLAPPTPVVGVAASSSDLDDYRLTLDAPATVRVQTFDATGTGCTDPFVDTYVEVFDANGTDLTGCGGARSVPPCDDSRTGTYCEDFTLSLPAGDSHVVVSGAALSAPAFVYTLSVTVAPAP